MWQLVAPVQVESFPIVGNLALSLSVPYTVFGDDSGLQTTIDGDKEIPPGIQYVWYGGHINTTSASAVRALWLANGFQVIDASSPELVWPDVSVYPSATLFPEGM